MRSLVLSNRIRCLSQVALVSLVGSFAVGCSSDVTRFDRELYAALPKSKPTAYEQAVAANNKYPGDVDTMTTASVNGGARDGVPLPIAKVSPPTVEPDHSGYNYSTPQTAAQYNTPRPIYNAAPGNSPSVVKSALPKPGATSQRAASTQTKTAPKAAASVAAGGWSNTGGTAIQMRDGETLYNLSKRYGVPVTEIMRANSIKSANNLKVGQQIIIPTYVYSRTAAVSAPDIDPKTRAASSSTGLIRQQNTRPQYQAALSPDVKQAIEPKKRYKPKRRATEPASETNPPDYSIVTGSVPDNSGTNDSVHIVGAGDVLGKIAIANNVSVRDLQQANGVSGTVIRVGQRLVIPRPGSLRVSSARQIPAGVDPIITGSTANKGPKPYVRPSADKTIKTSSVEGAAPKRSGIERLRWPVSGRIISKFGAKKGVLRNDGIDISVPEGTAVKAAENGVVIYSGSELAGFGNLILIRHEDGFVTAYAHNKSVSVAKGSEVRRGQVIALSGKTGDAKAPMLHFEVRKNSKPVNPLSYLSG